MTYPGPAIPVHAWRALHSGFVDEVLKSDPATCLAINDRIGGLGWESFGIAMHHGTLRARLSGVTLDDAWIVIDYAETPGNYRGALMMRTRTLGVDAEPLLRAQAEGLGISLGDLLGGPE